MSKQRRCSCNHSDAWHTINNVHKFAFMNKIPIETDIQQAVMRFGGHSQGVFTQHKSMEHMCWTNTWAGITHSLMEKVRRILAMTFIIILCVLLKGPKLAAGSGVGSPWGTANIALLGWIIKTCPGFSSLSPDSNPQPSLTVYQIILLGGGHEGGD